MMGFTDMGQPDDEEPINETARPDLDIATIKQLVDSLPDDWRIMIDSSTTILLFDAEMHGQGYIDLGTQQVVTLQA